MRTSAPELAPLFRSDKQGELLAQILLNPEDAFTTAELSRSTDTAYASVHREVDRLIRMGLVHEERVGRAKRVRADLTSPAYQPLVDILLLTYGPAVVLPQVLADVEHLEQAYIYGSWAARLHGEPGSPPGDIDVLAIGTPSRRDLYEAGRRAQQRLRREVNIRAISRASWESAADSFVRTLHERPLVELTLERTS